MKRVFPIIFLSLLLLPFFITSVQAQSQGLVPCDMIGPNACTFCDFFVMLDRWIDRLLFMVVPPLAALMIAIGGGMYIISQGNPEMLGRAKKLFTAVVIGLFIIYGSFLIIGLFLKFIGLAETPTNWYALYRYWWEDGLFIINCP